MSIIIDGSHPENTFIFLSILVAASSEACFWVKLLKQFVDIRFDHCCHSAATV
ncbi:MAG: hypothetical protein ACI88A_002222 [Paraglaciecola sp.]|jgi:hypothetical protein